MKPKEIIEVQLTDAEGLPLRVPNILLQIMLFTSGRWRYYFSAGATNALGIATIGYDKLEIQRVENGKFALMDYNTSLEDCDAEMRIHALTRDDINNKLKFVEMFYPDNFKKIELEVAGSNNSKFEFADTAIEIRENLTRANLICSSR